MSRFGSKIGQKFGLKKLVVFGVMPSPAHAIVASKLFPSRGVIELTVYVWVKFAVTGTLMAFATWPVTVKPLFKSFVGIVADESESNRPSTIYSPTFVEGFQSKNKRRPVTFVGMTFSL
jgi:hypothetical protein